MNVAPEVIEIIKRTLGLDGRGSELGLDTELLGALPEFDSMAVVTILTAIEESFGIVIDDAEVDGTLFETIGTLVNFVDTKLSE